MLAEVGIRADRVKMMEGAGKGRDMGEGAEGTGGEGGGNVVGAIRLMGKNFVVMLGVVFGGDVEETSVAEGPKVVEKLCVGRVS